MQPLNVWYLRNETWTVHDSNKQNSYREKYINPLLPKTAGQIISQAKAYLGTSSLKGNYLLELYQQLLFENFVSSNSISKFIPKLVL